MILTNADGTSVTACPLGPNSARDDVVEMFSAGWEYRHQFEQSLRSRAISVEFINPDHEDYVFGWLEMEPRRPLVRLDGGGGVATIGAAATTMLADCAYRCPELDVCVNASVWCDGVVHCPSGYDESFTHCSALLRLPAEILASICVVLLLCCGGLLTYLYRYAMGDIVLKSRAQLIDVYFDSFDRQKDTASFSRFVHIADTPEIAQLNGYGHIRREGRDQLTDG